MCVCCSVMDLLPTHDLFPPWNQYSWDVPWMQQDRVVIADEISEFVKLVLNILLVLSYQRKGIQMFAFNCVPVTS